MNDDLGRVDLAATNHTAVWRVEDQGSVDWVEIAQWEELEQRICQLMGPGVPEISREQVKDGHVPSLQLDYNWNWWYWQNFACRRICARGELVEGSCRAPGALCKLCR